MRTAFHYESVGLGGPLSRLHPAKRSLFFRVVKNSHLQKLFTIDESLFAYVRQSNPDLSERLQFVPDPVRMSGSNTSASQARARKRLRLSSSAVILLVYGSLSLRKGIDALLRAARHPQFPNEVEILLAGEQDEEVKKLLATPDLVALRRAGRVHEMDRFLNDEEERATFEAADIAWLGYRGHYGMSGVLVQAAMMGIPVIACDAGLLGSLTRKYELGLSVPVEDTRAIAAAVSSVSRDHGLADKFGRKGKAFASRHDPANFTRKVCDGLGLA